MAKARSQANDFERIRVQNSAKSADAIATTTAPDPTDSELTRSSIGTAPVVVDHVSSTQAVGVSEPAPLARTHRRNFVIAGAQSARARFDASPHWGRHFEGPGPATGEFASAIEELASGIWDRDSWAGERDSGTAARVSVTADRDPGAWELGSGAGGGNPWAEERSPGA